MELLLSVLNTVSGWVWGVPTLALILLVGIWLTVIIRGVSITRIPFAFVQLIKGRSANGEGTVAPFSALMMSLSATIGTGNIAGVATAIGLGGPGVVLDVVQRVVWHGNKIC